MRFISQIIKITSIGYKSKQLTVKTSSTLIECQPKNLALWLLFANSNFYFYNRSSNWHYLHAIKHKTNDSRVKNSSCKVHVQFNTRCVRRMVLLLWWLWWIWWSTLLLKMCMTFVYNRAQNSSAKRYTCTQAHIKDWGLRTLLLLLNTIYSFGNSFFFKYIIFLFCNLIKKRRKKRSARSVTGTINTTRMNWKNYKWGESYRKSKNKYIIWRRMQKAYKMHESTFLILSSWNY